MRRMPRGPRRRCGPADDAVLLDTTALDADAAFQAAMQAVRQKLPHTFVIARPEGRSNPLPDELPVGRRAEMGPRPRKNEALPPCGTGWGRGRRTSPPPNPLPQGEGERLIPVRLFRMPPATPITSAEFAALMAPLGPFEPAPLLAAAVSGGADSMALALLADAWASARGGSRARPGGGPRPAAGIRRPKPPSPSNAWRNAASRAKRSA